MGPNGQNQHFAELRQKVCLYIHTVVLLRGLPSLEGKNELFVGRQTIVIFYLLIIEERFQVIDLKVFKQNMPLKA